MSLLVPAPDDFRSPRTYLQYVKAHGMFFSDLYSWGAISLDNQLMSQASDLSDSDGALTSLLQGDTTRVRLCILSQFFADKKLVEGRKKAMRSHEVNNLQKSDTKSDYQIKG
jgi:hypothetical protein